MRNNFDFTWDRLEWVTGKTENPNLPQMTCRADTTNQERAKITWSQVLCRTPN